MVCCKTIKCLTTGQPHPFAVVGLVLQRSGASPPKDTGPECTLCEAKRLRGWKPRAWKAPAPGPTVDERGTLCLFPCA